MNKVELKGIIYSYGVSADGVEICVKTQDGSTNNFHKVIANMPREEVTRMVIGKDIRIEGSLRSSVVGSSRMEVYVFASKVELYV